MQAESIAEYFWPALSDNQSRKPIVIFLSGRLKQVLLYTEPKIREAWFIILLNLKNINVIEFK